MQGWETFAAARLCAVLAGFSAPMNKCPECGFEAGESLSFCPNDGTILQPAPDREDPLIGKVIDGKYRIIERLGGGGMGLVYKAEHAILNHLVAIKILRGHLANDEEYIRRFQREARMVSKLTHPNAITLHDFGISEGSPFFLMEFVEGRTLREVLRDDGALPLERIVRLVPQIVGALAEAHAAGIIHRDLKPENIMVTRRKDGSEWIKVLDFGIAKIQNLDSPNETQLTRVGSIFGSPRYMAPEQSMDKGVDTRADLYSLGIILYEMLAGRVPFEAATPIETILHHVNNPPRPLKESKPDLDVGDQVSAVVMRLLEKDPANRFQTAAEFLEAFHTAFAPKLAVVQVSPSGRYMIGGLSAGLVLLAAVFVYRETSNGRESIAPAALEELNELKAQHERQAAEASRLAEQKRLEAEEAERQAAATKEQATQALKELELLNATRDIEKRKAEEMNAEALHAAQLAAEQRSAMEKAASDADKFRLQREEEEKRAVELRALADEAKLLLEQHRSEAALATTEAEARRAAREEEEKRVEQLKLDAAAAEARAKELQSEVDRVSTERVEAEKLLQAEEAKRAVLQEQAVQAATPVPVRPDIAVQKAEEELALKRRQVMEAQREAELQRKRALEAARQAEAERARAARARHEAELSRQRAANEKLEADVEDEEQPGEKRRSFPRQGKRR
ncbi:MAG: protein kinase [Deltaproteobacteria bacterium]|nr:protein kinase [Deltaproteobacteria bacterium]